MGLYSIYSGGAPPGAWCIPNCRRPALADEIPWFSLKIWELKTIYWVKKCRSLECEQNRQNYYFHCDSCLDFRLFQKRGCSSRLGLQLAGHSAQIWRSWRILSMEHPAKALSSVQGFCYIYTMWGPRLIAKLVQISPISLWFMVLITIWLMGFTSPNLSRQRGPHHP